jgi:hypothetical protein
MQWVAWEDKTDDDEDDAPTLNTQLGTQFTCFTGTKVKILAPEERRRSACHQQATSVSGLTLLVYEALCY